MLTVYQAEGLTTGSSPDVRSCAGPGDAAYTAALRFSLVRTASLANAVATHLETLTPTGIYGDYDLPTLWHEFAYEVQQGPTEQLLDAWDSVIAPIVQRLLDDLEPTELDLLTTISADLRNDVSYLTVTDAIAQDIREVLQRLAGDVPLAL